jgi:hypothetical protein
MIRVTATLQNGRTVTGPIHGNGGLIGSALSHIVPLPPDLASDYIRDRLSACWHCLERGQRLPVYEPKPGCVAMYPNWSPASDGQAVAVPVRGTEFRLAK